jgi:hypothetical protein
MRTVRQARKTAVTTTNNTTDVGDISRSKELWELGIIELTGHNIETQGREEVNRLLEEGWILLHIYTLKYPEDGTWRERPMAILGRTRSDDGKE